MKNNALWSMGIDIGSTTAKIVVLNEKGERMHERYERHFSFVRQKALELVKETEFPESLILNTDVARFKQYLHLDK